jgi:glycosyltransferase involved in cell wall biosynthesis
LDSITYVSPRYPPYVGGVETHVSQLAKRAHRFFRDVIVITTDPSGRLPPVETKDGVTICRMRSVAPSENYHFPSLYQLYNQLRRAHPHVLHIHCIHDLPGPIAGFMAAKTPIVFTPHFVGKVNSRLGRLIFPTYQQVIHKLLPRVSIIICSSHYEAQLMETSFPESRDKIKVIPNGVDTDYRYTNPWKEPAQPTILYAGRLEKYKNVDKIIQAVSHLHETHRDLRLTIVGRGPFKEELQRLSSSLNLNGSTEWLEGLSREELFSRYSSSTVFVLPSESENFGMAAGEAIAVGTPTIVANASGLAEFVEEGLAQPVETPVNDVNLAECIEQVLEDPRSYSRAEKKSSIIKSWDEVAEATFDVYRAIAS